MLELCSRDLREERGWGGSQRLQRVLRRRAVEARAGRGKGVIMLYLCHLVRSFRTPLPIKSSERASGSACRARVLLAFVEPVSPQRDPDERILERKQIQHYAISSAVTPTPLLSRPSQHVQPGRAPTEATNLPSTGTRISGCSTCSSQLGISDRSPSLCTRESKRKARRTGRTSCSARRPNGSAAACRRLGLLRILFCSRLLSEGEVK